MMNQKQKDKQFLKFRATENRKAAKKEQQNRAKRHPHVSAAPHPGHSSLHN